MTIYYRGSTVLITDRLFVSRSPQRILPIDALQQSYVVISRTRWLRRIASYELRTWYDAQDTHLFSTRDPRAFGQVRRALIRALEHARDRREGLLLDRAVTSAVPALSPGRWT